MEKATPYSNLKIFAHAQQLNDISEGKRIAPIYIRIKPTIIVIINVIIAVMQTVILV